MQFDKQAVFTTGSGECAEYHESLGEAQLAKGRDFCCASHLFVACKAEGMDHEDSP